MAWYRKGLQHLCRLLRCKLLVQLPRLPDQAKRTQAAQALTQAGQVEYVEVNRVVKRPLTR
jgi:hypothetical protein